MTGEVMHVMGMLAVASMMNSDEKSVVNPIGISPMMVFTLMESGRRIMIPLNRIMVVEEKEERDRKTQRLTSYCLIRYLSVTTYHEAWVSETFEEIMDMFKEKK